MACLLLPFPAMLFVCRQLRIYHVSRFCRCVSRFASHVLAYQGINVPTCLLFTICHLSSANAALINVAAAKQGSVAIADSSYAKFSVDQAIDGKSLGPNEPPDINGWHSALDK